MKFPEKFKIYWWASILLLLTIILCYRIYSGNILNIDVVILIFWFILLILPIVDEIDILGISAKKQIKSIKEELNSIRIKNENVSNTYVSLNASPANQKEIEDKKEEEVKTIEEEEVHNFKNSKKERLDKIIDIENKTMRLFKDRYGIDFFVNVKLSNGLTDEFKIVDGALYNDGNISNIYEVKYFKDKNIRRVPFIMREELSKWHNFGLKSKLTFLLVFDNIQLDEAKQLADRIVSMLSINLRLNVTFDMKFYNYTEGKIINVC
jgi:hypothetical protein